jgi:HEAT repeat protein
LAPEIKLLKFWAKKNPQDVAVAFAELLGDPNTNLEVREFALNTMKGVKEENLVLSLLDTYNMGKREYYSLLKTMLEALGEFDDPEVKKSVIEIAISQDYPLNIRKKAVENLANFKDPTVIPKILPLLKNKHSYDLYDYIIDMIYALGQEKLYENEIRQLAFEAHFSRRSHE